MWMPTRAVVAGIGEGQQVMGGGPVQPWQGVAAGGGEVVHRAGLHVRNPQREPVGGEHRLDVAAVGMGLAGVPQVNDIAFHADGLLLAPVGGDDRTVEDHMRIALGRGPLQRRAQLGGLVCEHRDDLVQVPVGGGPRDAVIAGERVRGGAIAEPPQPQHRLPKAGQHPASARGAAPLALGEQQLRNEPGQFPGDVKRGTIGDHAEPSVEGDLWRDLFYWGSTPIFRQPGSSACLP